MTDDSDLFRTREQLERDGWRLDGNVFTRDGKRMLPLYEAKMVDFFNHRDGRRHQERYGGDRQNQPRYLTPVELQDPPRYAIPLNWIAEDGPDSDPPERQGRRGPWCLGATLRVAMGAGMAMRLDAM